MGKLHSSINVLHPSYSLALLYMQQDSQWYTLERPLGQQELEAPRISRLSAH